MSYERMLQEEERLKEEIEEMLEEAEATDREEDERFGGNSRGDELPEELERRRDRLEQIQEAKADRAKKRAETHESKKERKRSETLAARWETLAARWDEEAEQLRQEVTGQAGEAVPDEETPEGMPKHRPRTETDGTPKLKAQRNFTDPDSRIMEKGGEFLQGYNCQLLVDEAHQIIVAQGVTNNAADNGNFGLRREPKTPRRLQGQCWPTLGTGTRMLPKRPRTWEPRPTSRPDASRMGRRSRPGQDPLRTRLQPGSR